MPSCFKNLVQRSQSYHNFTKKKIIITKKNLKINLAIKEIKAEKRTFWDVFLLVFLGNGLKLAFFDFWTKIQKIPIFDFERLYLRIGSDSFHMNIISFIFRVYAITWHIGFLTVQTFVSFWPGRTLIWPEKIVANFFLEKISRKILFRVLRKSFCWITESLKIRS